MEVLERIADSLRIAREKLGVGFGRQRAQLIRIDAQDPKVQRRIVLEMVMAATVKLKVPELNSSKKGVDELRLLPGGIPEELTSAHVNAVRAATDQLVALARCFGGQAALLGVAAVAYVPWLDASGPDATKDALVAALADLHTEAGWCAWDEGIDGSGFIGRALEFGQQAKNAYSIAYATWHAAMTGILSEDPNQALKLCQLGIAYLTSGNASVRRIEPSRLATLLDKLHGTSATSYAMMNAGDEADRALKEVERHHGSAYESGGYGLRNAGIHLRLKRFDKAAEWTAASLAGYGDRHRRDRSCAELLQAQIFVRVGDSHGPQLAAEALDHSRAVIQSAQVRKRYVIPLELALSERKDSQCEDLARIAEKLATQG